MSKKTNLTKWSIVLFFSWVGKVQHVDYAFYSYGICHDIKYIFFSMNTWHFVQNTHLQITSYSQWKFEVELNLHFRFHIHSFGRTNFLLSYKFCTTWNLFKVKTVQGVFFHICSMCKSVGIRKMFKMENQFTWWNRLKFINFSRWLFVTHSFLRCDTRIIRICSSLIYVQGRNLFKM
jgi:hypothetical protein